MSDFKVVENRKYNDEEIKYVVSRIHANWRPEIIAKAFKRDHPYWAHRDFTKKQVNYIRSTYKTPPGIIKPYTGPIPQFSRSPTPEDSPIMDSPRRSNRKRKQPVAAAQNLSSSTQAPASERASSPVAGPSRKIRKIEPERDTSTHHEEASVSEDAGSPVAGPSRKRQEPMRDDPPHHGEAPVSERARNPVPSPSHQRQQPMRDTPTHHESLIQGQDLVPGFLSGSLSNAGRVLGDTIPQEPFNFNGYASDFFGNINYGHNAFGWEGASTNLSLDPSSPGMMGPGAFAAQDSIIPGAHDLLPDFPLQSIERHESIASGAGTNATNSAFPTPQQQQSSQFGMLVPSSQPGMSNVPLSQPDMSNVQSSQFGMLVPSSQPGMSNVPLSQPGMSSVQSSQLGMSNVQGPFPPGCTEAGAQARDDPHGVWYFGPHDECKIPLGHRHDRDGGVWFTGRESVMQSLLAMGPNEGYGFLLGVATAAEQILSLEGRRYLAHTGQNLNARAVMQHVARIVSSNVPEMALDRDRFQVPDVRDIQGLSQVNLRLLPTGYFYDPFHRRFVPYDTPGPSGTQDCGQGGGAAGSSRPSRQGSGHPGPGPS